MPYPTSHPVGTTALASLNAALTTLATTIAATDASFAGIYGAPANRGLAAFEQYGGRYPNGGTGYALSKELSTALAQYSASASAFNDIEASYNASVAAYGGSFAAWQAQLS